MSRLTYDRGEGDIFREQISVTVQLSSTDLLRVQMLSTEDVDDVFVVRGVATIALSSSFIRFLL